MPSAVETCNLALSHVGAYGIQALSDRTKEARECNRLYDPSRRAMLEAHDWSVARKREALALRSETYSGWDYAYSWPTDCIAPRKIYDESGSLTGTVYDPENDTYYQAGKVKFEVAVNDDLNRRIILTDKEDAELIYTADLEDVNLFTSLMVQAHAYRLAADLAIPLRADSKLGQQMLNAFNSLVATAQAVNANAEQKDPKNTISDFQKARG